MSVYFIDGPPASGKTTLINNIRDYIHSANKTNASVVNEEFMFLDSRHKLDSPEYSCDWVTDHVRVILNLLDRGYDSVFVDSSPLVALAYHPEIGPQFITEALHRLSGYKVHFWFIDVTWEETWWRIQSRLQSVSAEELTARTKLRETDHDYMEKRYNSIAGNKTQYDKALQKYYLLSLAKSII